MPVQPRENGGVRCPNAGMNLVTALKYNCHCSALYGLGSQEENIDASMAVADRRQDQRSILVA